MEKYEAHKNLYLSSFRVKEFIYCFEESKSLTVPQPNNLKLKNHDESRLNCVSTTKLKPKRLYQAKSN